MAYSDSDNPSLDLLIVALRRLEVQLHRYKSRYGLMPRWLIPGRQSPAFLALAYARHKGVLRIADHDDWGTWTLEETLRATRWLEEFLDSWLAHRLMRANGWPAPVEWKPPPSHRVPRSDLDCRCSQMGVTVFFDDRHQGTPGTEHTSSLLAWGEDEEPQ